MTFFVPESPRYLYGANNIKECTNVLQLIAKRNGVIGYDLPKFGAEYEIIIDNAEGERVSEGELPRDSGN